MLTLSWLAGLIRKATSQPERDTASDITPPPVVAARIEPRAGLARRSFLALGAMVVATGALGAFVGRLIGSRAPTTQPPTAIPLPRETLGPIAPGTDFALDGLTPIVVPNEDFYRIDTALTVPRIDAATWSLRIHGMVEREVTLTYSDLIQMRLYERYITIACVSNEVGGYLVGNAKWTGVSLASVLERAGVKPEATQLVGRSYSWTAGFPTAHLAGAGSEAMIALQMNGAPLPAEHGFPARLIVPGLYGYVSATKWLTDIELTTLEAFDAYWVPLGWAKEAPILTQSRIDLPRHNSSVTAGSVSVAGVAWAPTRQISGVEVQVDDGAWLPAQLSVPLSHYSWVQWRVTADLAAGGHTIRVRATDGTGATQAIERTPPAPDGARGYHEVRVNAA
jgi:DMSO/TMAO reductase YedYZ molybdopterin-dependent catalytic subunit